MTDPRSDTAFEARLRDLLAAELRAAEADYASLTLPTARPDRRALSALGLLVALVVLVGAVLLVAQLLGRAPLGPGGPTLRTFPVAVPPYGGPIACPAYLIQPNVSGTLAGDASDPEGVWLETSAGRVSVSWPAGFTLAFDPAATLYQADGTIFARAGDAVTLGQVPLGSHAGTPSDPYLAAGLIEARSPNGDTRSACAPAADGEPYATPQATPQPVASSTTRVDGGSVLSGPAIATGIAAATDDTPFLVSGFVSYSLADCFVPPDLPTSPLTAPCNDGWQLTDALASGTIDGSSEPSPPSTRYRLAVGTSVVGWPPDLRSPVVLRVHVHDPRATACAPSIRAACEQAMVVEAVVAIPLPGDARQATTLLDRYEQALIAGDWQAAWAMLAPAAQAQRGSLSDYISERRAYFESVAGRYGLKAPTNDPATLSLWLAGRTGAELGADLSRAFVIEVDYPALAGNNAGYEVDLVGPTTSGSWAIWELR